MTIENEQNIAHEGPASPIRKPPARGRLAAAGVAAILVLAVGAAGGAGAVKLLGPTVEMAPMAPVAISAMPTDSVVTIKGTVAEIFGNKFVLQDASGRMLVETGRAGEGGKLVAPNEAVTVQGRFDDGFMKASFVVHPDGKIEAIGPAGGPPKHGKDGPHKGKPGPKDGPKDGPKGGPADGPKEGPKDGPMGGPTEGPVDGPEADGPRP